MAAVRLGLATVIAVLSANSATAQSSAVRIAHDAYVQGDFSAAERVLASERRIFPDSPEVLVNLAAVYARTGRVQQATTLYRQVLARDDMLLDLSDARTVSSHAIATAGLRRTGGLQTATR